MAKPRSHSIDPAYSVALMASAGTGKTYTLALRAVATLMREKIVRRALQDIKGDSAGEFVGVSAGKILCITFTRKATAEMATRVNEYLMWLANGQLDENSNEYKAIAEVLKITKPEEMRKRASAVLSLLYKDPSVLQVRTIDSFVNMILRLFPFESDVSPDFEILDPDSMNAVKREAFELAFQQYFNNDKYHSVFNRYIAWADIVPKTFLNNLRDNIIDFVLEHAVTIERQLETAGQIDIEQIGYLLEDAERNSANMLECMGQLLKIIKEHGKQRKIYTHFAKRLPLFEDVAAGCTNIENCMEHIDYFNPERSKKALNGKEPMPEEYLRYYADFEAYLRNYVDYANRLDLLILLHVAVKVQNVINSIKADNGMLSFSDVSYAAYNMLCKDDEAMDKDYLYFRLDGRLEHILIDEFQDTSDVQWKLVQPLVDEAMAGSGQGEKLGSFFCVGDPKQTIYRFRGSNPNFFHNVINDYKGRLIEEKLEKNFRSDKTLVGFVNKLFANTDQLLGGGDDISFAFTEQQANSKQDGYVSLSIASGKDVAEVDANRLKCLEEQLKEIREVAHWRDSDIAILVAKRETGFRVQAYLEERKIKSHVTFSEKLNDSKAYKVISALVRYICYGDYFTLAEFLLTAPALLSRVSGSQEDNIDSIHTELDAALAKLEGQPIYKRLLALDGRLSLTARFAKDGNYHLLINCIGSTLAYIINPHEFAAQLATLARNTSAASSKSGEGIAIMTVHGSKGLQFPVVIVHDIRKRFQIHNNTRYFINEQSFMDAKIYRKHSKEHRFFSSESYKQGEELEEKLTRYGIINELYVASTRAQNMLYYTMGVSVKHQESTDSYVGSVFKEAFTEGVLCLAEHVGSATERKLDDEIPVIDSLYTDMIAALAAGEAFGLDDKQGTYPAPILKRAIAYVESTATSMKKEAVQSYEPYSSRYYGIFIHEIVYQLVFSKPVGFAYGLDNAVDKAWNRYGGYLEPQMKASARKAVSILVQNELWQELSSKDMQFYREKSISEQGKFFVVDLYAVSKDGLVVVDFKTGAPSGERHWSYVEQVHSYMSVLAKQYKRKATGYLIYLSEREMNVEEVHS